MTYRVVDHRTGAVVVGEDLRTALRELLADLADDSDGAVAADALADAMARGDQLVADVWADALNVTVTRAFPRQRR